MISRITNKKHLKYIILIFFVFILLIFGTNIFIVDNPQVIGNAHYSKEDILGAANIGKNTNIFTILKLTSEKKLSQLSYLETVSVEKNFPNKLTITITESKPIGYVPFSGIYLLIDKNGKVIDRETSKEAIALPVIEGFDFEEFKMGFLLDIIDNRQIVAAREIFNLLEKYKLISQNIQIDVGDPDHISLYIDELDVIIGEMDHLNTKIQWLSKVVDQYNIGILDLSNVHKGQAIMSPLI